MKRRQFIEVVGASTLLGVPGFAFADDDSRSSSYGSSSSTVPLNTGAFGRVVVVGGGMGGATVAKFLRLWGGAGVEVTLVERSAIYTSSIMSNLVLNGQRRVESLYYGYDALAKNYGVNVVIDAVTGVDANSVTLASGTVLPFDHLVLSPGIDFDLIEGLAKNDYDTTIPHAWKAGPQTTLLRNQIAAMRSGETFVMTIPKAPYRCPPGPYERACVVADWLKRNRNGAKVIVLDANPGITAEAHTFSNAFDNTYRGIIEYIPNAEVFSIDPASRTIQTSWGGYSGAVLNPIPPHRAGAIVADAGLVNFADRWADVNELSYASTVAGAESIHIIGDACHTKYQPKAGHMANAEAKVCADAIVRALRGMAPDASPVTNSACYSPISSTKASWLTAVFGYDAAEAAMKVVPGASGEAQTVSSKNYEQMGKWFSALMADTFV